MNKSDALISQLDVVFKGRVVRPSHCISKDYENIFYIDDNKLAGKCIIIKQVGITPIEEQKYFKIINTNGNIISLWAVDGCFMSPSQPERCDCIVFDDNDFCFVEFKLNATSLDPKFVKKNREKAISQLKSMILFLQNGSILSAFNLDAYLCTPVSYPNKNTTINSFAVEFWDDFGVRLYEENFKEFK